MFHRRFLPRQTMSLPAWIEVNSSSLLERCKLMDLSESGARLGITDVRNLPPQFNHIWPGSASLPINVESFGNEAMKLGWCSSHLNGPTMPQSPMSLRSCLDCSIVSPKRQADIFTASSVGCRNT
jgi:hypothetical protein